MKANDHFKYIHISGVRIHNYSFSEVVDIITRHISSDNCTPEYVVTPNADHILQLQKDNEFKKIYDEGFLSVPDGVSLLWASKILNRRLKERVNGTDLFEALCKIASDKGFKVFLLGGRPGAAETASAVLTKRHPSLHICGIYCPPFGFEKKVNELEKINRAIKDAHPDILFVGLGAPKQEKWIYAHYKELNVPVSLGIGVSFELVGNTVSRAPKWMQKGGLEWLYRLIVEPRRLWKRYLIGNILFVLLVAKEKFRLLFSGANT